MHSLQIKNKIKGDYIKYMPNEIRVERKIKGMGQFSKSYAALKS